MKSQDTFDEGDDNEGDGEEGDYEEVGDDEGDDDEGDDDEGNGDEGDDDEGDARTQDTMGIPAPDILTAGFVPSSGIFTVFLRPTTVGGGT